MRLPKGAYSFAVEQLLRLDVCGLRFWCRLDRWHRVVKWRGCRGCAPSHYPCSHVWERLKMEMPDITKYQTDQGQPADDESIILAELPCLSSFVGQPCWQGGISKGERALMLFWKMDGTVSAILKVANPPLKLVAAGHGFDEAMAAVEASLRLPHPPFQTDDNPPGKRPKKK